MNTDELYAAIDKQLPQMVGEQLKARLDLANKAEDFAKSLKALREQLAERDKEVAALQRRVLDIEPQEKSLAERESALTDRTRSLELAQAKFEAQKQASDDRVAFARETLQTVFRNREIVQTHSGYGPAGVAQPNQYNCSPQAMTAPFDSTTRTTEG